VPDYDLITIGGGMAGSALAKVMAESGARVLVLERERQFRDRVRGEALLPWGVAEARVLGLEAPLLARGGIVVPGWTMYGGPRPQRRDLPRPRRARPGAVFDHLHEHIRGAADRAR
jgi:2-polyprenyl-6-methoxyphenol hydroxylase-like FAD-dependent oxidoreductase